MAALYGGQKDEFVTSLAALALYDGEAEISSDNIKTLLAATNNTVAPYWPALFAGILKDNKIEKLVFSAGEKFGTCQETKQPCILFRYLVCLRTMM